MAQLMKTFISYLFIFFLLLQSSHIHAAPANISEQQAVSIAQQAQPGRVLGIKKKKNTYRVKMLQDNGEVKIILIDKQSGKIKSKQ